MEFKAKILKTRPAFQIAVKTLSFIGMDGDFAVFSDKGIKEARIKYFEQLKAVNK